MIILILTIVNVVSTLLSIVVLSFLYFQHSSRIEGIQYWLLCYGLNMVAFTCSASRAFLPESFAIMSANPLFGLSFIALFIGMGKFFSIKVNLKPYLALLALYVPVLAYYTFVENSLNARQFFLYVFLVIINLRIAYFLLKIKTKDSRGIVTFAVFTLFAIAFFFAVSMGIILSEQTAHTYFDNNPRDIMVMSTTIFTTILMTYAEVMLISARLLDNVKVSERKFSLVFDNTLLPVFINRLSDSTIYEVNTSFERLFGYTEKELIGKTTLDVHLWEDPDQRQYMINQINKEASVKDMEATFITKDGRKLVCQVSCNIVKIQGEEYVLNNVYDVTDSVNLREDLKRMATQDHLTGLANRTLFYDRFEQAKAQAERRGTQLSIIIMDMDKLKEINDTYGHLVGDRALVHLSNQISSVLRKSDTFARFGGDEFCIILNETKNIDGNLIVIQKIQEALMVPLKLDKGLEIKVQVSMGIAIYPHNGISINELIKHADKAMYEAKQEHCGYRFYDDLGIPQ